MSAKTLGSGKVFGDWTLVSRIGEGGNGVVWKATGPNNVVAAIKFIKSHHFKLDENGNRSLRLQRFLDEIEFLRTHGSIQGILQLIDCWSPSDPSEDDRPWLVTPLGKELKGDVEASQQKVKFTVQSIAEIAKVLELLHSRNIFHRDIKPDNILVIGGQTILSDFGLVSFAENSHQTGPSEFLGPQFFCAPEMMENAHQADFAKADVYSLAKTLWVLATGQRFPLQGEQRSDVPALTLSANVSEIGCESLDVLLESATKHDPNLRPSMRSFCRELTAWLTPLSPSAPAGEQLSAISKSFRSTQIKIETEHKRRQRNVVHFEDIGEEIHRRFEPIFESVKKMELVNLDGELNSPKMVHGTGEPTFWFEWPSAPRPLPSVHELRILSTSVIQYQQGLSGRMIVYSGAFRTALFGSMQLEVTAAHAWGTINSDARLLNDSNWSEGRVLQLGHPSAQTDIDELFAAFEKNMPSAFRKFFEFFEQHGATPPT